MMDVVPLESLGTRIMICGPSNAGKSTLAVAIGKKLDVPVVYLDLLYHKPNTDWEARPPEEFDAAHAEAIAGEGWVMEGNYSRLFGPRLERATGIVLLGGGPVMNALRYLRRTLFERERAGQIEGGADTLKWEMVHFILLEQPKKRERDRQILRASGLPMVEPRSMRELNWLCRAWDLEARR
jgi:adenylate kinase family enzyme